MISLQQPFAKEPCTVCMPESVIGKRPQRLPGTPLPASRQLAWHKLGTNIVYRFKACQASLKHARAYPKEHGYSNHTMSSSWGVCIYMCVLKCGGQRINLCIIPQAWFILLLLLFLWPGDLPIFASPPLQVQAHATGLAYFHVASRNQVPMNPMSAWPAPFQSRQHPDPSVFMYH